MKRRLFVCFLALTMLLSLTACGAASKTAASSANSRPADTVSATEEKGDFDADTNGYDDEGRDSGGSVLENQKIIYTGDINLETTESLTRPLRRWQHWRRPRAATWRAAP